MSHSLRRRRASSLAASSLSFCCRIKLSTISVYLLSAFALHRSCNAMRRATPNTASTGVALQCMHRGVQDVKQCRDVASNTPSLQLLDVLHSMIDGLKYMHRVQLARQDACYRFGIPFSQTASTRAGLSAGLPSLTGGVDTTTGTSIVC